MSLRSQLEQELIQRSSQGPCGACAFTISSGADQLELDLSALDSMSCAVRELRLTLDCLQNCSHEDVKRWADDLSRKITYLLEQIGPIEFDEQAHSAMIRSSKPTQIPQGAVYYEFVLQSQGGSSVTIHRYEVTKGRPGRTPVPLQLTHEVLLRLLDDLLGTCPGRP